MILSSGNTTCDHMYLTLRIEVRKVREGRHKDYGTSSSNVISISQTRKANAATSPPYIRRRPQKPVINDLPALRLTAWAPAAIFAFAKGVYMTPFALEINVKAVGDIAGKPLVLRSTWCTHTPRRVEKNSVVRGKGETTG